MVPVLNFAVRAQQSEAATAQKFSGGDSCGETPVPIPNTAVKSATPKILGWRRPGKIGTARIKKPSRNRGLFCYSSVSR